MIAQTHTRLISLLLFCFGSYLACSVAADTIVYEATLDFPDIEAGEVPYYSEAPGRASLAINAANIGYREKFARATTVYTGDTGYFNITLNTLAELDGEAVYRVFVNDMRIGSATNPQVTVDYTPIRHSFENVLVPTGATLAVESLANTNGSIPEGDGTAYARGRWTSLEMADAESGLDNMETVDLSVSAALGNSMLTAGDITELIIVVRNRSDSAVATAPLLNIMVPPLLLALSPATGCIETDDDVVCSLPEIPAGEAHEVQVSLTALESATEAIVQIAVSADQQDLALSDNTQELFLSVGVVDTADESDNATAELQPTDVTNASATTDTSRSQSGGGSLSWFALILVAMLSQRWSFQSGYRVSMKADE
ncbi:MAG: hypothetical protein AB8B63_03430 [Granulosicoccus sp.]